MFPFSKKGAEIQNPRNKSSQPPQDLYSVDRSVIAQPADGIPAPAPAPAPVPAPVAAAPAQPAEQPLSYTGVTHEGHQTIVLYAMKKDEPPVTVEQVLSAWKLLPDDHKFEVADVDHNVYCYDFVNGKVTILDNIYPGEGTCKDILDKHDARVAEYLAKLTGKKPADAGTGPVTAEALKATPFDELYKIFDGMDEKERQRIANAIHKAMRHHAEGKRQTGGGSKKEGGDKPAESAPQPKQPKPQPAPATNRSRYAGL